MTSVLPEAIYASQLLQYLLVVFAGLDTEMQSTLPDDQKCIMHDLDGHGCITHIAQSNSWLMTSPSSYLEQT